MKPAGLYNDVGQEAEVGHIIDPYKGNREDEFPVFEEEDLAVHFIDIFFQFHK